MKTTNPVSIEVTTSSMSEADAVVWVAGPSAVPSNPAVQQCIDRIKPIDKQAASKLSLHFGETAPGQRVVVSPTGPLLRDGDDVRSFAEAAARGVSRAVQAGAQRPALVVDGVPAAELFKNAVQVAALGAASAGWCPPEAFDGERASTFERLFVVGGDASSLKKVEALEWGRAVARNVTGTEPERMAPSGMANYCQSIFSESSVEVEVVDRQDTLLAQYPLLSAVARASQSVTWHQPRVIRLAYGDPKAPAYLLAGKGVTYDTGGADIKYGGAMAGMSRDKGGAGAVIGFFAFLDRLGPHGIRVVAEVGAVRNSVGSDAFVSDEIIRGHSGVRVRIGNTDAEGRLVLADLLSHLRIEAQPLHMPHLMSIATLTGHVGRALGPYTAALDNAAARDKAFSETMQAAGELWGDGLAVSRLRREDFDFVRPRSEADDVLSSNTLPSTGTPRGHQFPAAFLSIASGIDRRQNKPTLPFTHLDIGGSATERGDWQHGKPTGAPIVALAAALNLV